MGHKLHKLTTTASAALVLTALFAYKKKNKDVTPPSTTTASTATPAPSTAASAPTSPKDQVKRYDNKEHAELALQHPLDAGAAVASNAQEPGFLLWSRTKDRAITQWVAWEKNALVERAHHPGVVVAARGALWTFVTEKVPINLATCDSIMAGQMKLKKSKGKGLRAFVERMDTHRRILLASLSSSTAPKKVNDYRNTIWVEASAGPYLFVRQSAYEYSCGVHGGVSAGFSVFDLSAGAETELLRRDERAQALGPLRARAMTAFASDGDSDGDLGSWWTDGPVKLVMLLPRYSSIGRLELDYVFAGETCYACGDGEWSSYTLTKAIRPPTLPRALAPYRKLPAAVARFVRKKLGGQIKGWSRLAGTHAETSELDTWRHGTPRPADGRPTPAH